MSGVPSRKQATEIFNRIDRDGNGSISPKEFADYVKSNSAMDWFLGIDADNDKKISLDELLEEVLKEPRAQALDKAFQVMDSDASKTLQKTEVLDHGPKVGLTDTNTIEVCFGDMDKDGSGFVDKEEFIAHMNKYY